MKDNSLNYGGTHVVLCIYVLPIYQVTKVSI